MNEWSLFAGCVLLMLIALAILLQPLKTFRFYLFFLVPIFVGLGVLGYWHWGFAEEWIKYKHQQVKQEQVQDLLKSVGGVEAVIVKLKTRVEANPTSARGWYLLGRLYASQGHWKLARDVYQKAYQLSPTDTEINVNYAYSLWQFHHMQFTDEIRSLYKAVLIQNANQTDALAMLAMDAYSRHAYQESIDYWQHLLKIVPPQSEEARAIQKAIVKAEGRLS